MAMRTETEEDVSEHGGKILRGVGRKGKGFV